MSFGGDGGVAEVPGHLHKPDLRLKRALLEGCHKAKEQAAQLIQSRII